MQTSYSTRQGRRSTTIKRPWVALITHCVHEHATGLSGSLSYVVSEHRNERCHHPHQRSIRAHGNILHSLTSLEAVLKASRHGLQVLAAPGAGGLSALRFDGPVVRPDACCRVATRRACLLLDVEGATSTSSAQSVRLVVA